MEIKSQTGLSEGNDIMNFDSELGIPPRKKTKVMTNIRIRGSERNIYKTGSFKSLAKANRLSIYMKTESLKNLNSNFSGFNEINRRMTTIQKANQ